MSHMVGDEPWHTGNGAVNDSSLRTAASEDSSDIHRLILDIAAEEEAGVRNGFSANPHEHTSAMRPRKFTRELTPETETFQRLLPKRIDSQTTETTAATTEMSNDSFLMNKNETLFDNESCSGASYFQESYAQMVRDKLGSQKHVATSSSTLAENEASFKESYAQQIRGKLNATKQAPISRSVGKDARPGINFFQQSYAQLSAAEKPPSLHSAVSVPVSHQGAYTKDSYAQTVHEKLGSQKIAAVSTPADNEAYFKDSYAQQVREKLNTKKQAASPKSVDREASTSTPGISYFQKSYAQLAGDVPSIQQQPQHVPEPTPAENEAHFKDAYAQQVRDRLHTQTPKAAPTIGSSSTPVENAAHLKEGYAQQVRDNLNHQKSAVEYAVRMEESIAQQVGGSGYDQKPPAIPVPPAASEARLKESYAQQVRDKLLAQQKPPSVAATASRADDAARSRETCAQHQDGMGNTTIPQGDMKPPPASTLADNGPQQEFQAKLNTKQWAPASAASADYASRQGAGGTNYFQRSYAQLNSPVARLTTGPYATSASCSALKSPPPSSSPPPPPSLNGVPSPYQHLKRFMRAGMGRLPDDQLKSMAASRTELARQASHRASVRGSAILPKLSSEELQAIAPGEDESSLSYHKRFHGQMIDDHDHDDGSFSGDSGRKRSRSIDMSGSLMDVSPIGSPVVDRPRSVPPPPTAMMPESTTRQHQHPQGAKDLVYSLEEEKCEEGRPSLKGAAELFEEFHESFINTEDIRPGAYTAEGPPMANIPQWNPEGTVRLEPPRLGGWNVLRRMSSNFSRRGFFRRSNDRLDVDGSNPRLVEEVDERSDYNSNIHNREIVVDARVNESGVMEPQSEHFNFSSIPPELRPVQDSEEPKQQATKKKRARGFRKFCSKMRRGFKAVCEELISYI